MPKMPTVWLSLKKSLHCNSVDPQDVHQPRPRSSPLSSSSSSFSNLFRGSRKGASAHAHSHGSSSPCSIASNDTATHKMLQEAKLNVKDNNSSSSNTVDGRVRIRNMLSKSGHPARMFAMSPAKHDQLPPSVMFYRKLTNPLFQEIGAHNLDEAGVCIRCAKHLPTAQALESHFISEHGVEELEQGDPTRNVVEIIFRSSWTESENNPKHIEKVFKINNNKKTLARFEEYRESVKRRATKKHPRCMADGNEVLRFHGTTLLCSLADKAQEENQNKTQKKPRLCDLVGCSACNIIRSGFQAKDGKAICTASNTVRAHESMASVVETEATRAMLVCRVIAGRVHKPLSFTNKDSFCVPSGFDSVAGNTGSHSKLERLFVSNPKALLPCFLIVYSS